MISKSNTFLKEYFQTFIYQFTKTKSKLILLYTLLNII